MSEGPLVFEMTVGAVLATLFPHGTRGSKGDHRSLPAAPTTVFGAVMYLLERGGVYQRIIPAAVENHPGRDPENIVVDREMRDDCCRLGRQWIAALLDLQQAATDERKQALNAVRAKIGLIWQQLCDCDGQAIHIEKTGKPHEWCVLAYKLLVIADEAAQGFGYRRKDGRIDPFAQVIRDTVEAEAKRVGGQWHVAVTGARTFAPFLNPKIARVLPKSRTSSVGCTGRVLSHNLALVPPHGVVDFMWISEPDSRQVEENTLNLLLIPFPYRIRGQCFQSAGITGHESPSRQKWGWFNVDQLWLCPEEIGDREDALEELSLLVLEIIKTAEKDFGRIHGVIFPELALNSASHKSILEKLRVHYNESKSGQSQGDGPPIDFLICGSSENPVLDRDTRGNFVAVTSFHVTEDTGELQAMTYVRAKHHRWQINQSQITNYGLAATLDPNVVWWEGNSVINREIGLTVFKGSATFAVMICEDLARSEPCHEPLRALGPSIVFVLLMDGPQLQNRWPARYSTILADDPGSSVLTLTSLGLIERSNQSSLYPPSRDIAIWKDDSGQTIQIGCPTDAQAVVVNLSGVPTEEFTLDARLNNDARAWRYRGHQSVKLDRKIASAARWGSFL